jgi:hypothetical protein
VLELAPYCIAAAGCQGFKGPFPSAFLDKKLKRTGAKIKWKYFDEQIFFLYPAFIH